MRKLAILNYIVTGEGTLPTLTFNDFLYLQLGLDFNISYVVTANACLYQVQFRLQDTKSLFHFTRCFRHASYRGSAKERDCWSPGKFASTIYDV